MREPGLQSFDDIGSLRFSVRPPRYFLPQCLCRMGQDAVSSAARPSRPFTKKELVSKSGNLASSWPSNYSVKMGEWEVVVKRRPRANRGTWV